MKKNLLLLGAMALLASCSQNSVEETFVSKQQISFSNLNNKTTLDSKAGEIFEKNGANEKGDDYKVFASTSLDNHKTWYINDDVVGNPTSLDFNAAKKGPYYWLDANTTFKFYAYAPSTLTTSGEVGDLSIDYTVNSDANQDFTIAKPITTKYTSNGTVNLEFLHMLAKINIDVVLTQKLLDAGYVIKTKGTSTVKVNVSKGTIKPTVTDTDWASQTLAATYSGQNTYNIMPQPTIGCSIQLNNLVITKNGVTVYPLAGRPTDLKVFDIKTNDIAGDKFEMGKMYNLTFTINNLANDKDGILIFGQQIIFTSKYANWTTVTTPLTQK